MSVKTIPPEFHFMLERDSIPWKNIRKEALKREKKGKSRFEAFTDAVIDLASKESMKSPNEDIIELGVQACLFRGRLAEALFLSTEADAIQALSLRAIGLFVLSDVNGLREIVSIMSEKVEDDSNPSDKIRLSTVKVLLAAAERDTSVIMCVMEFDNLLETYPEQVEEPLTETMFTMYVVGALLREVGEANRASRIADTLEDMAEKKNNRMFLGLSEILRGNICNLRGDLEKAEKHYLRMKELSEELSFNLGLGMVNNNLGTLRLNSLRLEEALETFERALDLMEVDVLKYHPLINLGEICLMLGKYEDSQKYFKDALKIEEKLQSGTIETFAYYSILLSRLHRYEEAEEYLNKAEVIARTSERPLQKCAYHHAVGVFASTTKKWKTAIESYEYVLKIAKENSIFEFLVRSELELARTYLDMYMEKKDEEYLGKAAYHLDDLIQLGKEQGLQSLYAEGLLLRSDVLRLANKDLEAKGDIERVISVARFVGDKRIQKQAELRIQLLEQPVSTAMEQLALGIEKSMDRAAGFKPASTLKEVPLPHLHAIVAIHRNSALAEFVHHFDSEIKMDSHLLSGFISAITTFTSELMGHSGLLRSINHEGFTLMMEHTEYRIVTLIVDKETFDIRYLLREFAKRFETKYPGSKFDGMIPSDYVDAQELVNEVFT